MWTLRRRAGGLTAALACAALLGACSGGDEASSESAAGSSTSGPASSSPAAEDSGSEDGGLAEGLLPAEAFGAGATVIPLSREQLAQGAGLAPDPESVTITPESCAAAVEGTQPQIEDYDEVAAQSATVGSTTTAQVLMQGEATEGAVDTLGRAVANCPRAQVSSPELGEVGLTFEGLDAPDLGDAATAVRYTTTVTQGGQEVSIPALVGVVQDGDRVISLLTIATDGSQPDAIAFASLLEHAFEVQAEALG